MGCRGQSPGGPKGPPILDLRFDPNENNTAAAAVGGGGPIHQELGWIRLTAVDQGARGTPYQLQLNLNRPPGDVSVVHYYYTTNLANPTQTPAPQFSLQTPSTRQFRRLF